jgi:ABC-type lipoprotein release transport system permease subunit
MLYFKLNPIHIWGSMAQAFISYGIQPLMPLAVKADFIVSNITVVLVIVAVTCIYPVRRIIRLKVVDALHK